MESLEIPDRARDTCGSGASGGMGLAERENSSATDHVAGNAANCPAVARSSGAFLRPVLPL
jgi:hypothetical protein